MKTLVVTIAATVVSAGALIATPANATIASGNVGSIVKVSNTCTDMAKIASNNVGSIVKIDGGGTCDINDVLKGVGASKNVGSIIKISNVCGDASDVANHNVGSIVKIESNGACKKDKPTTVEVVPVKDTPAETTSTTPTTEMPAELPKTGLAAVVSPILGLGSLAYAGSAYIRSRK